jgi:hypothetical protein
MPNSPANPLPAAFYGPQFRCRQARPNRSQANDIQHIIGVRGVF